MAGFSSIDNFISEMTGGKCWRQEFSKLYAGGTAIAGNWYDLTQGNGVPAQYLHGNMITNADFMTSQFPWILGSVNWAYTSATHLMTRTANADVSNLYQTLRMKRGNYYYVRYTLTRSAGSITPYLGGTAGTARSAAGTFQEVIQCGATDKNLTFTPDATFAGTVDLVSVQPMLDFMPYNDLCEGSLWHGGDTPAGDTKHLVNMGVWANFATGLPAVLALVDVLGVYPRILCNDATPQVLQANSNIGTIIHNCQAVWNAEVITNVTNSLVVKTTEVVTGANPLNTNCVKLAMNSSFTTGKMADVVVASNMTRARWVQLWIRSSISLNAGDLSFCTDEHTLLASSQDVTLPAISANTWTRCKIDVSQVAKTDLDTVISIGLKCVNSKAQAYNVYVDDVCFVREDPCIFNGHFTGASTGWTLGANWAYRSNDIERTANASITTAYQDLLPVVQKCPHTITYTIANRSAGGVTVSLGGTMGIQRTVDGTYTETIVCGTNDYSLAFTPDATFNGRIDEITCYPLVPRADELDSKFGKGVRMLYVLDNALTNGAGAANVSVMYTNQDGTELRQLGATVSNMASDVVAHLPHSGVGAGKYGPYLPLNPGDYGIRSVQTFQFSGAQAVDAAMNLLLVKPITSIPITTAYVAAERDLMNQLPSLPRIRDGACLMLLVFVGGVIAAGSQFQGYIDTSWS